MLASYHLKAVQGFTFLDHSVGTSLLDHELSGVPYSFQMTIHVKPLLPLLSDLLLRDTKHDEYMGH